MSESQRASRQRWAAQQRRGRLRPRTDGRRGQRRARAKVAEQRRARAEKMRRSMVFSVGIYLPIIKSLGKNMIHQGIFRQSQVVLIFLLVNDMFAYIPGPCFCDYLKVYA